MQTLNSHSVLGILGGGQLGRMLIQKAIDWNIVVHVMDSDPQAPCRYLAEKFVAEPFSDFDAVIRFGRKCTHLTIEIEHVNCQALYQLEQEGIQVFPQPAVLEIVQDKGKQKNFFNQHEIPTAAYRIVNGRNELMESGLTYPFILKQCRLGYDGRGVMLVQTAEDLKNAFHAPSVVEEQVAIHKELSVIVARNKEGEISCFPVVEMVFNHQANLVNYLFAPADISSGTENKALELAAKVANSIRLTGIMAVEMFLTNDNRLLVNEVAPRPHNSGHHTIEANVTSQYEQLLRTIFGFPLGSTVKLHAAAMVNLLGEEGYSGQAKYEGLSSVLGLPGIYVHLYGKKLTRPFRKMGHVTITASSTDEALQKALYVKSNLKVKV
ncbi:MAG: 5-(carboxyamino)imidazole ribonucleotide synthase [Bacteroidia bacterium]|nr:5-(carboxyamino)imidazole ribonucleotide synthase [Bacteroidia bacterium]MCZ2277667.1 5-(carboxyamino)imidazole ribonucleotide synthase [Bacteroidia bacterium]